MNVTYVDEPGRLDAYTLHDNTTRPFSAFDYRTARGRGGARSSFLFLDARAAGMYRQFNVHVGRHPKTSFLAAAFNITTTSIAALATATTFSARLHRRMRPLDRRHCCRHPRCCQRHH